ncbi:restriction endonuclease subunit S [Campylobacter devanensis]|uniref:restriction endonuclease subunit S n=1 Tax=Campylobacter devanensis TaxID=3161138 RepID=UPI00112F8EFC|nr:restriction endonuclease subunit S [Campylobacter sp. P160]
MSKQNMEFKDSGILWIGQIPKHWEVIRNKYVFTHKKEIVGSKFKNFDILSLTKNGIKIIVESDQKGKVPDSFETYQIVKKDDIVMCLFDLDVSAVFSGISKYSGIISPAYKIFNPKENLNFKYAGYFFDFVFVNRKFKQYSKNIRFTLGTDEFMNLKIPLPPLNEQKKIAEFLDKKCEIIDKRLSNLERKIKSLKEYKKSLISECVTTGLNPKNMEFKDSGIPWIGQIPKHWEISKIKYHGTARNGLTYSPSDLTDESGILVLRSSNVQNSKLVFHDNVYVSCSVKNNLMVKNNDILICSRNGSRNLIGKNALIDIDIKATFGAFMLIYRSKISKFMFYVLNSNIFSYHLSNFVTSTINQLTNSNFENIKFPLPPLNEQKEIAEFLDKKCEKIDRLNENYTKQITALKEYKKSLIYECVTGKKEI